MKTIQTFLSLFSELERTLKIEASLKYEPFMVRVRESKNPVLKNRKNYDYIEMAAHVRNIIVHNHDVNLISPSEEFVKTFKALVHEIKNPKQVQDVMKKKADLFYCEPHQTLKTATDKMFKYHLSNIPILKDDRVQGMFSESSIFLMMEGKTTEIIIDLAKETFEDHLDLFDLNHHPSLCYPFIQRKMSVYDALDFFTDHPLQNEKKVELLLITNNGLAHEPLQGILTAYDLLDLIEI